MCRCVSPHSHPPLLFNKSKSPTTTIATFFLIPVLLALCYHSPIIPHCEALSDFKLTTLAVSSMDAANSQCVSDHGPAYYLAMPSSEEENSLANASMGTGIGSNRYLGGLATGGRWYINYGPDTGRVIWISPSISFINNRYHNYINNATVVDGEALYMEPTGSWNIGNVNMTYGICQRTPCTDMCGDNIRYLPDPQSYYPNCNCMCKPGWQGDRCDILFTLTCAATRLYNGSTLHTQTYYNDICKARGGYLAAPQGEADRQAILSLGMLSPSGPYALTGGVQNTSAYEWYWVDGPYKDVVYSDGAGASLNGQSTYWFSSQPNGGTIETGMILWNGYAADDFNLVWSDDNLISSSIRCYVCQFEPRGTRTRSSDPTPSGTYQSPSVSLSLNSPTISSSISSMITHSPTSPDSSKSVSPSTHTTTTISHSVESSHTIVIPTPTLAIPNTHTHYLETTAAPQLSTSHTSTLQPTPAIPTVETVTRFSPNITQSGAASETLPMIIPSTTTSTQSFPITRTIQSGELPTISHSHYPHTTPPTGTSLPPSIPTPSTQPLCTYTCADTVALQYITPTTTTTPQHAIDAYLGNISTFTTTGCTALTLPFTATADGTHAWVLMHITAPLTALNNTFPLAGMVLSTTKPGAMQASIVAANYTADGGLVVVFDVRRVDASPTNIVSGSVVLPGGSSGPFFCTPTSTLQQSGLPWANIALGAPPPALSEGERTAVAVLAMASADLQTVAAIGMLRCSPGSDEDVESEAGIRALVPVALSGTCAGAVQGALLAIGAAGVLSVVAMCIVRAVKKKDGGGRLGWVDAAAMVRCPGVVIAVWAFVQMGLVVCGARLATSESGGSGDIVLGVVGVLAGAVLPVVCIGLAWGVVSRRCYRLAQVPEAVAGRSRVVVWARSVFLPSYELDAEVYPVSKAFSTVVGRTRRPSCVWAGLPVIQPVVMLFIVFVTGDSCDTFLIVTGVAMMLVGALCHVLFRPHRIVASNYLQGIAMALNAAVLFIASKLVGDPLNVVALDANSMIAMIQVAFSVCRTAHTVLCVVYMRFYGKTMLKVVSVRKYVLPTDHTDTPPHQLDRITPVFDVHCSLLLRNTKGGGGNTGRRGRLSNSDDNRGGTHRVAVWGDATNGDMAYGISMSGASTTRRSLLPPTKPSKKVSDIGAGCRHQTLSSMELKSPLLSMKTDGGRPLRDPLLKSIRKKRDLTSNTLKSNIQEETKKFVWNPKEYVPMERPYTMLYEEDFTPPDDESLQLMDDASSNSEQMSVDDDDLSLQSSSSQQY